MARMCMPVSSGAKPAALHMCPYVILPGTQDPPAKRTTAIVLRTLEQLAHDYDNFVQDGSRLSKAKVHNNVIRPAMLPVPIEDVCIPALHLDLGIYPWMFTAMLSDLRVLDLALARQLGQCVN